MKAALLLAAVILSLAPAPAAADAPDSQDSGPLLFLGNQNLPPMVFLENDDPKGVVVDLVREIEKKMGREIRIRAMNWSAAQRMVAEGGADALVQINETPEREKVYDFSDPLLESRFSIFVNAGSMATESALDLHGLRVGVETNGLPYLLLKEDPLVELIAVPTILDGFYQLKDDSLDAVVVDEWVGKYILASTQLENIEISGAPVARSHSAIAVRKGDSALLAEINRAIGEIRADGSYAAVLEKWRPTKGVYLTGEQLALRRYRSAMLLLALLVLVSLLWMALLSRQLSLRKKTERTLADHNQFLSDIIEGTNAGTWELNLTSGYISINELWAQMIGYTVGELAPVTYEKWKSLLHPDDVELAERILALTLEKKTDFYNAETRMRHKDGRWIWVNNRGKVTVRDKEGKPLLMSGVHIDITARKIAEEQNAALLAEKELVLKEVHHRIKNNMNTIYGLIMMQASVLKSAEAAEALNDTANRVKSMAVLYDRIYRSNGNDDLRIRDYLEPLVGEIISNFPNGPAVTVETKFDDTVLEIKRLQPLGIIVNELLTNIMKYAFAGRIRGSIAVTGALRDGRIAIAVEDDGIGMPESVDFENSTGFGLVLVHGLTGQLDGTIRIERGHGTRIVLEFGK